MNINELLSEAKLWLKNNPPRHEKDFSIERIVKEFITSLDEIKISHIGKSDGYFCKPLCGKTGNNWFVSNIGDISCPDCYKIMNENNVRKI